MSTPGWQVRGTALLALGVLFALAGTFGAVVGVGYLVGFPLHDRAAGVTVLLTCGILGFIPAVIFFVVGLQERRHGTYLLHLAGLVRTYRRIRVEDLATKLGLTPNQTETFLAEAIQDRLLTGSIDPGTREFVLLE